MDGGADSLSFGPSPVSSPSRPLQQAELNTAPHHNCIDNRDYFHDSDWDVEVKLRKRKRLGADAPDHAPTTGTDAPLQTTNPLQSFSSSNSMPVLDLPKCKEQREVTLLQAPISKRMKVSLLNEIGFVSFSRNADDDNRRMSLEMSSLGDSERAYMAELEELYDGDAPDTSTPKRPAGSDRAEIDSPPVKAQIQDWQTAKLVGGQQRKIFFPKRTQPKPAALVSVPTHAVAPVVLASPVHAGAGLPPPDFANLAEVAATGAPVNAAELLGFFIRVRAEATIPVG